MLGSRECGVTYDRANQPLQVVDARVDISRTENCIAFGALFQAATNIEGASSAGSFLISAVTLPQMPRTRSIRAARHGSSRGHSELPDSYITKHISGTIQFLIVPTVVFILPVFDLIICIAVRLSQKLLLRVLSNARFQL